MESNEPKPTEIELTDTLTEFYQRGQSEAKVVGPPPPFRITSDVQSFTAPRRREELAQPPGTIVPEPAFPLQEKDFDFIPTTFTGGSAGPYLYVGWFFRCHDRDAIPGNNGYYIRMFSGGNWRSYNPPGFGGPISYAFNGSYWYPPPYNYQGAWVFLTLTLYNLPDPALHPITEGHVFMAAWAEEVGNPSNYSQHIYAPYVIYAWNWYYVQYGIGFDLTFHWPGP